MFLCNEIFKTLIIRYVFDKIDVLRVHQEYGDPLVLSEIGQVFFLDVGEVFGGDVLLEGAVPLGDLGEQAFRMGVKVENEVWFGQEPGDGVEDTLEQRKLVVGQVVFGEEQAFVDEIVADDKVREKVAGGEQAFELLVSVHEERHLHGKSVMLGVFVELFEERVVCETFQHQLGVEVAGQHGGEGGLARTDAALHDDIVIWYFHLEFRV